MQERLLAYIVISSISAADRRLWSRECKKRAFLQYAYSPPLTPPSVFFWRPPPGRSPGPGPVAGDWGFIEIGGLGDQIPLGFRQSCIVDIHNISMCPGTPRPFFKRSLGDRKYDGDGFSPFPPSFVSSLLTPYEQDKQ